MENSSGSHGTEDSPKKSRSLDLKSLYESEISKESENKKLKRKASVEEDNDKNEKEKKSKKKKIKKAVSLSSLKNVDSNGGSKSLYEVYNGSSNSGLHDTSKDVKTELVQKLNCKTGSNGIFLHFDENDLKIPRRKRDFKGRSKFGSKIAGPSTKADNAGKEVVASDNDVGTGGESSKVKRIKDCDVSKENTNGPLNSDKDLKREDENADHSIVKNGKSSKKSGKSLKKKKKPVKESKPLIDDSAVKKSDEVRDDDEENLEENAARMLSSRFDTSCTDFSQDCKGSDSPPANGLSFFFTGSHFIARGTKRFPDSGAVSLDSPDRVLRPRTQPNEKGNSRQRRHYYEISAAEFDASWMLNKKIKVFWPLDQNWYYGTLSEYDEEKKLHHVKYDDRDEEWINLQTERFKLLLLPSEAPGISGRKRNRKTKKIDEGDGNLKPSENNEVRDLTLQDDSSQGSHMDSEPISSWLARFHNNRFKSSSSQKQKVSSSSDEECLDKDFSAMRQNSKCDSVLKSSTGTKKPPIVYVRKRFRKSQSGMYKPYNVSPFERFASMKKQEDSLEKLNPVAVFWAIDATGFLKFITPLESRQYRFKLNLPLLSVFKFLSRADTFRFFPRAMLNQYGAVTTVWPSVHLEMLFVDNMIGLRYHLFEGSLKQVVPLVFVVLSVFHQHSESQNYNDQLLPVTSIRFKFSCLQGLKRELVFAFYNFAEVDSLKWKYLESKLEKGCSLAKQLPLSECTLENITALQHGTDMLPSSSTQDSLVFKGLTNLSRQGVLKAGPSSFYSDRANKKFAPFTLPFTAVPTFFVSLHLKLLMGPHINFGEHDSAVHSNNNSGIVDDSSSMEDCSYKVSAGTLQTKSKADTCTGTTRCLSSARSELETVGPSVSSDGSSVKSSHKYQNGDLNADEVGNDTDIPSKTSQVHDLQLVPVVSSPKRLVDRVKPNSESPARLNVDIPEFDEFGKHAERELNGVHQPADLSWNMNGGIIRSPNPTGRRSTLHRGRGNSSLSFGHGWSDGKTDFFHNNFNNGPKKPRTQVSYSLPPGGVDYSSKNKNDHPKGHVPKRIRGAHDKSVSRSSQKNLEFLSCVANVLITLGDRGWRESGAQIVLELFDHNEWKIAAKISGVTKYTFKAHQFLQPGSTNRYSHAMMWKGGKDWILEFPDRTQWVLFKEMHEECYNRNFRAASVKNIPIPGVRLVEDNVEIGTEPLFVRNSLNYFQQIETDVEMALNPYRVVYDMDTDDEKWISETCSSSSEFDKSSNREISDENFEKTMDMFEKAAYGQQRDQFTIDEIEQFMAEFGSIEIIMVIYDYWRRKRQKKGTPLIRHFQEPLWQRYQRQVKEWETAMSKIPTGFQEKSASLEKPVMSAFCLKPRGLEVPNKGSKQRSQKKSSYYGKNNAMSDHDGYYNHGRRSNGFVYGTERAVYSGNTYDIYEDPSLPLASPRLFSPRDISGMGHLSPGSDGFGRNHLHRLDRTRSKKFGTSISPTHLQMIMPPDNRKPIDRRNRMLQRYDVGFSDWSSNKYHYHHQPEEFHKDWTEQLEGVDLDEFRLREAFNASKHARNVAKLKRERAQKLLCRADLAIHKALSALMTAEAIKASAEDSNGE
ncbi:hypothetical protein ACFE04_015930 [Oxalis oulophora]